MDTPDVPVGNTEGALASNKGKVNPGDAFLAQVLMLKPADRPVLIVRILEGLNHTVMMGVMGVGLGSLLSAVCAKDIGVAMLGGLVMASLWITRAVAEVLDLWQPIDLWVEATQQLLQTQSKTKAALHYTHEYLSVPIPSHPVQLEWKGLVATGSFGLASVVALLKLISELSIQVSPTLLAGSILYASLGVMCLAMVYVLYIHPVQRDKLVQGVARMAIEKELLRLTHEQADGSV